MLILARTFYWNLQAPRDYFTTEVVKWLWPSKPKANKKSVFTGLKTVDGQTVNFKTTKENSFAVFLNMREMFTLATVRPLVFIVLLL